MSNGQQPKHPHVVANVAVYRTSPSPNVYDVVNIVRRAIARDVGKAEAVDFEAEVFETIGKQIAAGMSHRYTWRVAYEVARSWVDVILPQTWLDESMR